MLKPRGAAQECLNHEARQSGFRPDKTRAASFLSGSGRACVNRVHNNYAFVNVEN